MDAAETPDGPEAAAHDGGRPAWQHRLLAGGVEPDPRFTLANERTFLAWVRTALALLAEIEAEHGPVMFHLSGGCCDGSAPMCYPAGDFTTGAADVLLGTFALPAEGDQAAVEIPFWMSAAQFEYWKHTHLTLDVVDGRGSGFSVEVPEGKRFLIRSRLMAGSG